MLKLLEAKRQELRNMEVRRCRGAGGNMEPWFSSSSRRRQLVVWPCVTGVDCVCAWPNAHWQGTASAAHAPLIASLIKPLDDAVAKYQDIRRKRMKRTATRGAAAAAARKRKEPSP